jgi:phosphoribosylanthranilate isomerase
MNVGEALRLFTPAGVDVVSGVEREPGRKDYDKVRAFIASAKRAETD